MTRGRVLGLLLLVGLAGGWALGPVPGLAQWTSGGWQGPSLAGGPQYRVPDGTATAPGLAFGGTGGENDGLTRVSDNVVGMSLNGAIRTRWQGVTGLILGHQYLFGWAATTPPGSTVDVSLTRQGAGMLRFEGVSAPLQLRTTQTTAPTCITNCGTSPSVAGSDTAGLVTMGATGTPASGWVVQFNGTWSAAPACIVQASKTGMVAGKAPIVVATTTTTFTVTTNGTAPAVTDVYAYHCVGVS